MTAADTTIKTASISPGRMNSKLNASAVAKSVTNVDAMMILPMPVSVKPVSVKPVSTNTAYTTASEVVESATPVICAACRLQCSPQ